MASIVRCLGGVQGGWWASGGGGEVESEGVGGPVSEVDGPVDGMLLCFGFR